MKPAIRKMGMTSGADGRRDLEATYDKSASTWSLGFEQYLDKQGAAARPALRCLIGAGCKKVVIVELLHGHCIQCKNHIQLRQEAREIKRQAQLLTRNMRSLSDQLQRFHHTGAIHPIISWAIPVPLESVDLFDDHKPVGVSSRFAGYVPSLLNAYADLLEGTWCDDRFLQPFKERSIELPLLAAYVKTYAGRHHYSELCTLLDAAECYDQHVTVPLTPRDSDALRKEIDRFRQTHQEYVRQVDRLIDEYEKRYGHTHTGLHFLDWIYPRQAEIPLKD